MNATIKATQVSEIVKKAIEQKVKESEGEEVTLDFFDELEKEPVKD